MAKSNTPMKIGSLVGTPRGIFGVISKFNQKDNRYIVSWAGGMRKGENIAYDKEMVDHLIEEGSWLLHYTPTEDSR